ncbi:hypothetical protein [Sphingomonas sp. RS2018]
MTSPAKPSFFRLFVGGFAIGTAAMVSIHLVQPSDLAIVSPAQAQSQVGSR